MDAGTTEELSELAERKLRMLRAIKQMTLEQADLVAAGDVDALLPAISRKAEAIEGLQEVQRQLMRFAGQDPEARRWANPQARQTCRETLAACDALIAELLVLENQSIDSLSARRIGVGEQLRQMHSGVAVDRAYAGQAYTTQAYPDPACSEPAAADAAEGFSLSLEG